MSVEVVKNGYTMFIVGTSKEEILETLVKYKYPTVKAMVLDSGCYHIIAEDK
jgi:hypothetical protein